MNRRWWHVYDGVVPDARWGIPAKDGRPGLVHVHKTLGPTTLPPDRVPALITDVRAGLRYVASFDHQPSEAELDALWTEDGHSSDSDHEPTEQDLGSLGHPLYACEEPPP